MQYIHGIHATVCLTTVAALTLNSCKIYITQSHSQTSLNAFLSLENVGTEKGKSKEVAVAKCTLQLTVMLNLYKEGMKSIITFQDGHILNVI